MIPSGFKYRSSVSKAKLFYVRLGNDWPKPKQVFNECHIMENLSGQADKLELYIVLQNFTDF